MGGPGLNVVGERQDLALVLDLIPLPEDHGTSLGVPDLSSPIGTAIALPRVII